MKKGLQWLLTHQDPEGCIGERGMKYMYNHTIAALALSEAYGMTASQPLKEPAQKAIDFLVAAQNPGKGWRYSAKCGDNDSSVTGWAVMALKSAELSELSFPKSAYEGALNWFNEATETNGYYQVGYNARSTGKVYVPGKNEQLRPPRVDVRGRGHGPHLHAEAEERARPAAPSTCSSATCPSGRPTRSTSTTGTTRRWPSSSSTAPKARCGRSGTSR